VDNIQLLVPKAPRPNTPEGVLTANAFVVVSEKIPPLGRRIVAVVGSFTVVSPGLRTLYPKIHRGQLQSISVVKTTLKKGDNPV
jgi:hypothetical protein